MSELSEGEAVNEGDFHRAGAVQVLDHPNGGHMGMAILVSPFYVVTCAHVVNSALGRDQMETSRPPSFLDVHLVFMGDTTFPIGQGRVCEWFFDKEEKDLSVLQLTEPAPASAGLTIMADVPLGRLDGTIANIFARSPSDSIGTHFRGTVRSPKSEWVQIDHNPGTQSFTQPGFSGSSVWNNDHCASIGLLSADSGPGSNSALLLPTAEIKALWPKMPSEKRRIPKRFDAYWPRTSLALVVLQGLCFLGDRSNAVIQSLPMVGGSKALAMTWGLKFSLIGIVASYLFMRYAQSFSQHMWWRRVPSYIGQSPGSAVYGDKAAAWVLLVVAVLMPLYFQAYFLDDIHRNDAVKVFIYPKDFGFTNANQCYTDPTCNPCDPNTKSCPTKCDPREHDFFFRKPDKFYKYAGTPLLNCGAVKIGGSPSGPSFSKVKCEHADQGWHRLYQLHKAEDGTFPYRNSYHIGDEHYVSTQTFFPIAEPLFYWLLFVLNLVFFSRGLIAVFAAPKVAVLPPPQKKLEISK